MYIVLSCSEKILRSAIDWFRMSGEQLKIFFKHGSLFLRFHARNRFASHNRTSHTSKKTCTRTSNVWLAWICIETADIKATKVLIIQVTWRYSSRRPEGTFAGHLFIKLREKKHLWNLSGPEVVSWSTAEQGKSFNQVNQDHFKQLKQY